MPEPDLTRSDVRGATRGLVLMLHGGVPSSLAPVGDNSASWLRSAAMMRQISPRLHRVGIGVWLLKYRQRGWNEQVAVPPSPVPDARAALEEVRSTHPGVPVVLLGHSMGGRASVVVADDPSVVGVVALAPWLPAGDPNAALAGRHLLAAHGRADTITSARQTREFVRRAGSVAATAEFRDMGRAGHYMLRRRRAWNDVAVEASMTLLQRSADLG